MSERESLCAEPFGLADPRFNEVMRLGLIATLRLAEDSMGRCWDAGQTGGVVREHSLDALSKVRSVIGILEQVRP